MAASAYTATPHRASLRISTTSEDANVRAEVRTINRPILELLMQAGRR
jgi:hypothetical protein